MYDLLKIVVSLVLALWLPLQAVAAPSEGDCHHQMQDVVQASTGLDHEGDDCCKGVDPSQLPSCEHCSGCCLVADGSIVHHAGMTSPSYLSIPKRFRENDIVHSHLGDPLYKPPRSY